MYRLINNINGTIEYNGSKECLLNKALKYQTICNKVYYDNNLNLKAITIDNDKTIILTNNIL